MVRNIVPFAWILCPLFVAGFAPKFANLVQLKTASQPSLHHMQGFGTAIKFSQPRGNAVAQKHALNSYKNAFLQLVAPAYLQPQAMTALAVNLPLAATLLYLDQQSLTKGGLLHATLLGVGLWSYLGWRGWLMGVVYFIFGSLVTKLKMAEKERLGIAEKRHGARGPENVWGSAATALICAMFAATPLAGSATNAHRYEVAFVAAFATKLADTFSSEIGKAYGTHTYLSTTLQPVPKGTEGAVSLEGTLSGILGSVLLSLLGVYVGFLRNSQEMWMVIVASFVATQFESLLGASWQTNYLNNEVVNFIMTVMGAAVAFKLHQHFFPF